MSQENVCTHESGKHKLPIGISTFEYIRQQGFLYVDKTAQIYRMITEGVYYFLSRPRRFGKSLLVSTLSNLFQGRKELFAGLWIAEHGQWDWQTYPVIALDFSEISNSTPDELKQSLLLSLNMIADDAGVSLHTDIPGMCFKELIYQLARGHNQRVVVLIDEYDKPIIDHLGKGSEHLAIAQANRDILKSFFGILKGISAGSRLRFVLLTGISRFSKVSIFSELNNLDDISMSERYPDLLGYTQIELENYFQSEIEELAQKFGWSYAETLAKLAEQYNGYRFTDKAVSVYNPFSILKSLSELAFGNYWFETGTPSFLINVLKQHQYELPQIEAIEVSQPIFTTYEIDRIPPEALLFQTGYVTIKAIAQQIYTLGYPNQEVKQAFAESLFLSLAEQAGAQTSSSVLELAGYLKTENFEAFFRTITAIFASIPYDIQTKRDEAYFHTLFYLMLSASGTDARSSMLTCKGRIDLAVVLPRQVYIIEFKCDQSAAAAIQQIQEKRYADPYRDSGKKIMLMGINFSQENRNIAEWTILPVDESSTATAALHS